MLTKITHPSHVKNPLVSPEEMSVASLLDHVIRVQQITLLSRQNISSCASRDVESWQAYCIHRARANSSWMLSFLVF